MEDAITAIVGDAPVLDRDALERVQRIGGERLVQRMIGAFLDHVPARVDALVAAGDGNDAGRTAHAIKSSAGNLGLERLRLLAQEVEARAELGDESWSELRVHFAQAMGEARAALEQQMERSS